MFNHILIKKYTGRPRDSDGVGGGECRPRGAERGLRRHCAGIRRRQRAGGVRAGVGRGGGRRGRSGQQGCRSRHIRYFSIHDTFRMIETDSLTRSATAIMRIYDNAGEYHYMDRRMAFEVSHGGRIGGSVWLRFRGVVICGRERSMGGPPRAGSILRSKSKLSFDEKYHISMILPVSVSAALRTGLETLPCSTQPVAASPPFCSCCSTPAPTPHRRGECGGSWWGLDKESVLNLKL